MTFTFLETQLWIYVTWDYAYKICLHQFVFMIQNWVPDVLLIKTIQIGFQPHYSWAKANNVRMSTCTLRQSNWAICIRKYYAITLKHFFSKRCTSTASKTETVKRYSKIIESGMLRKFRHLFKNVRHVTVTAKGKWELFFQFCTNQHIFVLNRKSISWRYGEN